MTPDIIRFRPGTMRFAHDRDGNGDIIPDEILNQNS